VARDQGNSQEAIALLDESLPFARRSGNYWCATQCLNEKARVLLDMKSHDEAHALLNESLSLGLQLKDKAALCNCVRNAARIAIVHNHLSEAVILLSVAELLLELKGVDVARRHVSHDVTHVRSTIGDTQFESLWNDGRRMPLEHLVPIFEAIIAPAETGVEHQAALQELTSRELEVLRLLAQGLTSMEIAGTLSVSPNTVSTHIRSIFSKLGVNTRSAATRYALTHGLA
jgi:DNA-binding CsgD family transcriptional regulator